MITRIDPPLPVECPKGRGLAHFLIDYGIEHDLMWVVFLDESAECWTFRNPEIRACKNITVGRQSPAKLGSVIQSWIDEDSKDSPLS